MKHKVQLLKKSRTSKTSAKNRVSKSKKLPAKNLYGFKVIIGLLIFAAVATTFTYFSLAEGEYPGGSDDIVLEYRVEKPTSITRDASGATTGHEQGLLARVMGDSTVECTLENSADVYTGKLPSGQLKQLFKEVNTSGLRGLPDEQFLGDDTENFVGNLESISLNSTDDPKVAAIYSGVEHQDVFDRVIKMIKQRCDYAKTVKPRSEMVTAKKDKITQKRDSLYDKMLGTQTAEAAVTAGYMQSVENDQLYRINAHRATHSRKALFNSGCMNAIARLQAKRMADAGGIYHNQNLANEINYACGTSSGTWYKLGENVGVTASGSESLFNAFLGSTAHHINIDDAAWEFMAVGAYRSTDGKVWVAQVYADCPGCGGPWTSSPTSVGDPAAPTPTVNTPPKYYKWDSSIKRFPVSADYDGDKKLDAGMWSRDTGIWYVKGQSNVAYGVAGDVPIPGDYNGDGKSDHAIWRKSDHTFRLRNISSFSFGQSTDVPVPADYNSDGKTDAAVYRAADGKWYVRGMGTGGTTWSYRFGIYQGDIPLPGDYNGDGKTDLGLFRASTHAWYAKTISGSYIINNLSYGRSTDIPVPADYNGDKKTDVAVWRPSDHIWYARGIFASTAFGVYAGDVAAPGDYDNTGNANIAILRPSNNTLYYRVLPTDASTNTSILLAP